MAGPWENYGGESGPWAKYAASPTSPTPHDKGTSLKGTPTGFPNTFMGTLSSDVANLPASMYQMVRHPIDTLTSGVNTLLNLPETIPQDVAAGNWGKLGARTLEPFLLGGSKALPELPELPENAMSTVGKVIKGGIKGGTEAFTSGKSSLPAAAMGGLGYLIKGPPGAKIGGALGALPGTIMGVRQGIRDALLEPMEPITPFPPGKGTGTKYGGPATPDFSPPSRAVSPSIRPSERIPTVQEPAPQAPTPYKAKPGIQKLLRGTPSSTPSGVVGKNIPRRGWAGPPKSKIPPIEETGTEPVNSMEGTPEATTSPIVTPTGQTQPSALLPNIPEGTITIPPVPGRPLRYNTMAVQGGGALSDMTFTKDMRLSNLLRNAGIKPAAWAKWSDAERDAYAVKYGYEPFGKGGKLGRQTHAEGARDVFDRLTELWGQ